jgi:putative ABC transport system permease protein
MIDRIGLRPILSSLRLHLGNVAVIALQVILAMVVVCNALYIAVGRLEHVKQLSGLQEERLLSVYSSNIGSASNKEERASGVNGDLERLRMLPGVQSVTETFSLPLSGATIGGGVAITSPSDERRPVSYFFADPNALQTLGLRLLAGRNFSREDMSTGDSVMDQPGPIIVTAALATRLYGGVAEALGKPLFLNGGSSTHTIVGIIDRMEIPSVHPEETLANWYTVLLPIRYVGDAVDYVARSSMADMNAVKKSLVDSLLAMDPTRVIDDDDVLTFREIRDAAFASDLATARIMFVIVIVLLIITAAGLYGLISSWVRRRTRAIGIRRALGAARSDIVVLLQTENLIISGASAIVGGVLALHVSAWMMHFVAGGLLPLPYAIFGAIVVVVISQSATLVPSIAAANASPVSIIRQS